MSLCLCVSICAVPKEFEDATLLAVGTNKRCVGIKMFHQPYAADRDGGFEEYIERCIRNAVVIKESIEMGVKTIENDAKIVQIPDADQYVDVEKSLEQRAKSVLLLILQSFFGFYCCKC